MPNVGLVIQGPLVSVGRSGANPEDLSKSHRFDTLADVKHAVAVARTSGFSPIFVSTWKSSTHSDIDEQLPDTDATLFLNDPIPCAAWAMQKEKDNRIRQAIGCAVAVSRMCDSHSPDFIVRVRTDQWLDFAALRAAVSESRPGELRVLGIWRPRAVQLIDFVIGGTAVEVKRHYDALCAFDCHSFHDHIHFDMFFKDAYACLHSEVAPEFFFPKTSYVLHEQLPIFRFMYARRLRPLPIEVIRSVRWRGDAFTEAYIHEHFLDMRAYSTWGMHYLLENLPRRGVVTSSRTLPHFIDLSRMRSLGLASTTPVQSWVPKSCARFEAMIATQFRRAARW